MVDSVNKPTREHSHRVGKRSVERNRATVENFDLVLIATNHNCVNYHELSDWRRALWTRETLWPAYPVRRKNVESIEAYIKIQHRTVLLIEG